MTKDLKLEKVDIRTDNFYHVRITRSTVHPKDDHVKQVNDKPDVKA